MSFGLTNQASKSSLILAKPWSSGGMGKHTSLSVSAHCSSLNIFPSWSGVLSIGTSLVLSLSYPLEASVAMSISRSFPMGCWPLKMTSSAPPTMIPLLLDIQTTSSSCKTMHHVIKPLMLWDSLQKKTFKLWTGHPILPISILLRTFGICSR